MSAAEPLVERSRHRLLILGGSTEASQLARDLRACGHDLDVVLSFAGRTTTRNAPPANVDVRVGGFGGIDGLQTYLRADGITVMVDATHPFAAHMPFHAAAACRAVDIPLLRIVRPAWTPGPDDRWTHVPTMTAAAAAVQHSGAKRVLLTIGRQELQPFVTCSAQFVVRSIDAPDPAVLANATILLARAPFSVDQELAVLRDHDIDLVVSKNAGGDATRPKLDAARHLGIAVVMVARPSAPAVETVVSVHEALAWVLDRCGQRP